MLISVCIFELKIKLLFGGAYTYKGKFSTLTVIGLGLFVCLLLLFFFLAFCSSFFINMIHIFLEYEKQASDD